MNRDSYPLFPNSMGKIVTINESGQQWSTSFSIIRKTTSKQHYLRLRGEQIDIHVPGKRLTLR